MAIDKGNIKTSANYDVKAQKPLDGRAVRPTKADLIKKESWSSDGNTVYVYEGMQVYVEDEKKTYYLKDLSKMFATDFSGWELMGTGAAAEIEVDTELSDTSENAIANSTVSRALAGKQERLMDGVNIKTINGQNVLGRGNITIEGGGGGSSVEVVDSLDSESTTAALSANQGRVLKEMIEELPSEGTGGGLELRELKMSGSAEDNAYNLETLELMRGNKVLPAMNAGDGTLVPMTYGGNGQFILQVAQMGIEIQMSLTMAGDGSITMSQDFIAPYVLNSPSKVLEWLTKSKTLAQVGMHEPVYVIYNVLLCLVDCIQAGVTGSTRAVVQFNFGSQRFERVYDATTGEEISTTEIPLGGGTAAEGVKLYPIYVPYFLETESLTTEQQQANADAVAAATNGDKIILELLLPDGLKAIVHSYSAMDGGLVLDLARSSVLNLSDYQAYVDMVILSADGSVAYDSHDAFTLATKEYVDDAVANSGGGGGSIAVDNALSSTSTNPVQNKVLTEVLEGKTGFRYLYPGANDEEKAYNLETLRMLNAGFKGNLFLGEPDSPQFNTILVASLREEQWQFISIDILLIGGLNAWYYIDETGEQQIQMDESVMEDLLYNKVMFPFAINKDHRAKLIEILANTDTIQAQMYTIARQTGHNNGAIYFAWKAVFGDDGNVLGAYAYYYNNGICIDAFNPDGSAADTITLPIRVGDSSIYNVYNDLGYDFLRNGDMNVIVKVDALAEYHPISIKPVDQYDSFKGYLITILRDLKLETYLFLPDGSFTLDSEVSLTQTI